MSKIILIHPKYETHIITPSLGLGYLAATLINEGHKVNIIDCVARNISHENVIKTIKKEAPDIVGITIMSMFYKNALELIQMIQNNVNVKIIIGGPHVSALPEHSLIESKADFAIVGEGEETLKELVAKMNQEHEYSKILGICFWSDNKVVTTPPRPLIANLDTIAKPAWHLISPDTYPPSPHGGFYERHPTAPIITTRGCPFNCTFCASKCTWKRKLRTRSAINVVDEIEFLINNFGIKEFHFEDDNFTFSKEHAMKVCNEIIKRKLDIVWACPNGVRIDKLDKELITRMKQSGCYLLAFGIESGSQTILDKANKKLDLKIVSTIINMTNDIGIKTWGFFLIGLPGDTNETIEATIKFSLSLPLDRAQFSNFIPLPGTDIYNEWSVNKNNNINWNNMYFTGNAVFETEELTSNELTSLQKKAFRSFYLRPTILIKTILNMKPRQYRWFLKRILSYKLHKL